MDTPTLYGVSALTFMMLMYALERRGSYFILAFALGCASGRVRLLPVPTQRETSR